MELPKEFICEDCNLSMVIQNVGPCFCCGGYENELNDFIQKYHKYYRVSSYGFKMILCDFCINDFDSIICDWIHAPIEHESNYDLNVLETISDLKIDLDFVCPKCSTRMKFYEYINHKKWPNKR